MLSVTVATLSFKMAPPLLPLTGVPDMAELLEKVLLFTVIVPPGELKRPPPPSMAELLDKALLETVNVPRLQRPPPRAAEL